MRLYSFQQDSISSSNIVRPQTNIDLDKNSIRVKVISGKAKAENSLILRSKIFLADFALQFKRLQF